MTRIDPRIIDQIRRDMAPVTVTDDQAAELYRVSLAYAATGLDYSLADLIAVVRGKAAPLIDNILRDLGAPRPI